MKRKKPPEGGLVYSSSLGRTCPGCERPVFTCACERETQAPATAGPVRVRLDARGRRGKSVTVVAGVPLGAGDLAGLAKELRKRCGSGGTVRDGVIEIQGDHRDLLVRELESRGWAVRSE